jgi:hypothetical protein
MNEEWSASAVFRRKREKREEEWDVKSLGIESLPLV